MIFATAPANLRWRKSSHSASASANCVEVAHLLFDGQPTTAIRDSKHPTGPALALTTQQWRNLIKATQQPHLER